MRTLKPGGRRLGGPVPPRGVETTPKTDFKGGRFRLRVRILPRVLYPRDAAIVTPGKISQTCVADKDLSATLIPRVGPLRLGLM
jgi:hypothetical protein